MNVAALREQFEEQLGTATYTKFLKQFNHNYRKRRRLRFWHEQEWKKLCERFPEYQVLSFDDLVAAFRICHVHKSELYDVEIPVIKELWCVYETAADGQPRPYAQTYAIDSPSFDGVETIITDRCPDCFSGMKHREPDEIRAKFVKHTQVSSRAQLITI